MLLYDTIDIDIDYYTSNAAMRIFKTNPGFLCCYKETKECRNKGHKYVSEQ